MQHQNIMKEDKHI